MAASAERPGLVACVGHFAVPDEVQLELLRSALTRAGRVRVFITRAFQAPSARLPFGWRERADMLAASLDNARLSRIDFEPVREHWDAKRTLSAVQAGVAAHHAAGEPITCLWSGPEPEPEDRPRGWTFEELGDTDARGEPRMDALYAAHEPEAAWDGMQDELPSGTREHVRAWLGTPAFERLREEWRHIDREKKVWAAVPYPVTLVTVDAVVRASGHLLLIERGRPPGRGLWALPGGFLEREETLLQSALRELLEETGLPLSERALRGHLRGVKVFDHPERSQRGRVVTHAHFFDLGDEAPPPVRGGDDARAARWVPIAELAGLETRLHDDHFHVIDEFLGLTRDP